MMLRLRGTDSGRVIAFPEMQLYIAHLMRLLTDFLIVFIVRIIESIWPKLKVKILPVNDSLSSHMDLYLMTRRLVLLDNNGEMMTSVTVTNDVW